VHTLLLQRVAQKCEFTGFWIKVNNVCYNVSLWPTLQNEVLQQVSCRLFMLTQLIVSHVKFITNITLFIWCFSFSYSVDLPATTGIGDCNRKTVCFQCVGMLCGLVVNDFLCGSDWNATSKYPTTAVNCPSVLATNLNSLWNSTSATVHCCRSISCQPHNTFL